MSFPSLSGLSDRDLLCRVKALVQKERATTLEILVHLNEVERRKLHLSLGYPSLFEYCTRHLGYSSSAAGRRIHAARCVRDFPEVYGLLEKNDVTLITVSLVASILNKTNKDDLLGRIRRRSQREVEAIVAAYRPPVKFRDLARPVCVAVTEPQHKAPVNSGQLCPITPSAGSEISPNVAASTAGGQSRTTREAVEFGSSGMNIQTVLPQHPSVRLERRLLIQFLASPAFMRKFEEARSLLSNTPGKLSYETVLETALDEFLAHHSPRRKRERREKRKRVPKPQRQLKKPVIQAERPRRIPAAIRDAVFTRDKGRCTFKGATGEHCDSTRALQIDHIVPFARGGTNAASNLRLLCGKHNRLEAERVSEACNDRDHHRHVASLSVRATPARCLGRHVA